MQLKLLVLFLYIISNIINETAAEGNSSTTKYIHQVNVEGVNFDVEANDLYKEISITGLISVG